MDKTRLYSFELKNLHQRFIVRLHQEGKSASSITSMKSRSLTFLCYLEEKGITDLTELTHAHLDHFFAELRIVKNKRREGGLAPSYINKFRNAVLRLIEFHQGVNIGESTFDIPSIKVHRTIKHVLSKEQMQLLFEMHDNSMDGLTNKAILSTLYGLGLRVGELHNLNISDIDLHKGVVHITKTKTRHQRVVPMTKVVQHHIENYIFGVRNYLLPSHEELPAFMVSRRAQRMHKATVQWRLNAMQQKAKIPFRISPHLLRHSIATHLLKHLSLEEIATFLGHQNIDSTQIYTHVYYESQT